MCNEVLYDDKISCQQGIRKMEFDKYLGINSLANSNILLQILTAITQKGKVMQ